MPRVGHTIMPLLLSIAIMPFNIIICQIIMPLMNYTIIPLSCLPTADLVNIYVAISFARERAAVLRHKGYLGNNGIMVKSVRRCQSVRTG